MDVSDRQLIELIAQADQAALQQLYNGYAPRLRLYVWQQLNGDSAMVEEVLQDIFIGIWQSAGSYRGNAKVSTWIFRIAYFCVTTRRRSRARQLPLLCQLQSHDSTHNKLDEQSTGSWEDVVIDRIALAEAWQELSDKQQEVLDLVFQHGFTIEETAHILDIPVGTVKSRINSARQKLLQRLKLENSEVHVS
jgi:RNA polymerase sigma factor (sigma-70 family)